MRLPGMPIARRRYYATDHNSDGTDIHNLDVRMLARRPSPRTTVVTTTATTDRTITTIRTITTTISTEPGPIQMPGFGFEATAQRPIPCGTLFALK
jgi:hypothetical protein